LVRAAVFYFTNPAAVRGPSADVEIPPGSAALDYELEVAVVIGREGSDLSPAEAADHIAGFMLFCDWSARDLQGAEMRLNLGPAKRKDSANSFGPWLVTADELALLMASVTGAVEAIEQVVLPLGVRTRRHIDLPGMVSDRGMMERLTTEFGRQFVQFIGPREDITASQRRLVEAL
jgi:fumarylacetoacetate (FAA) hydrolase family protein